MSYKEYLSKAFSQQQIKSDSYCTQFGLLSLVILCLISFSCQIHANTKNIKQSCKPQIISVQTAKALPNNQETRPSTGWVNVQKFPDFTKFHWPNYKGDVWYQIKWSDQCSDMNEPLGLVISHINMTGKVYLNNDLLWKDQSLVEPLSRSWNVPRIWSLPRSDIQQKNNTLWIYVASSPIQEANLGQIHIDTYSQVLPLFDKYQFNQRTLIIIGFIINIIVGIFYFMVWIIYRKESAYLWISICIFLWVAYSSFFIITSPSLTSFQLERFLAWLFSTYTIVSCISIWRFANLKFPKIEKLLLGVFVLATIVLALVPNEYLKETIQAFFILNMIIFILENTTYPFLTYNSKQIEVYIMAASHAFFVPVSIHDAHQILTYQSEFWSPFISPFTALILGLLLGLRLYRNNKLISKFNETLTSEIETVTQKLSSSLKSQYELALENIRLQERINLSRDLHDGIGGSLVRSIELVKRNEHIEKDNILSILKLLSSDLRQVIDHGSSLDAQTPESPVLWAAPTRHRFMEIFDELNIQANWHLDSKWTNPPSPLQCLTLTRVLEEAFTNIIKHSKADKVEVTLTETAHKLTLKIHDNGIGFNPNYVSEATHVGLQSMQMRVARIAGQFVVNSSEAGTEISIIFDL